MESDILRFARQHDGVMTPDHEGRWVLIDDHEIELNKLQAKLETERIGKLEVIQTAIRLEDMYKASQQLAEALQPFAAYACNPVNSCDDDGNGPCHNCKAKAAITAYETKK